MNKTYVVELEDDGSTLIYLEDTWKMPVARQLTGRLCYLT